MGDPKRLNRRYDIPRLKWNTTKIYSDKELTKEYGLKNKKEIWKAETEVRKLRKRARSLLAGTVDNFENRKKEMLERLINLKIFTKDNKIEDVLKLTAKDFLERRLQTIVFRKGFALTPTQARQLIVHGHIAVNGKKRTVPGSLITIKEDVSFNSSHIKNVIDKAQEMKGKPVVKDNKKDAKEEVKE